MPVQIGSAAHSFSNPTGLLSDCHRRVEMFLGSLKAVADVTDRELTDETRRSLDLALRYFREAAPKHTADEEDSLFPRLRTISDPELQACLARLDVLEEDHRWAEPLHQTVEELGKKYLQHGRLTPYDAHIFRESVHKLHAMYERHIAIEDKEVFPVVDRVLSAEMKAQIAQEMAARRGTKVLTSL
jgi:hemerythrin-like domain-containing protein